MSNPEEPLFLLVISFPSTHLFSTARHLSYPLRETRCTVIDLLTMANLSHPIDFTKLPDEALSKAPPHNASSASPKTTTSPTSVKPTLSSLDMLSPAPTCPEEAPTKSATAYFLQDLHAHIISILNRREWTHPDLSIYFSPDMTAYMEFTTEPYVTSREAFIGRYKTLCEENEGYGFEMIDAEASVDEAKGAAVVWFKLRIWGHPEGVEREGVYVSMWRRTKGNWVCHRQNGLRGMKVGEGG